MISSGYPCSKDKCKICSASLTECTMCSTGIIMNGTCVDQCPKNTITLNGFCSAQTKESKSSNVGKILMWVFIGIGILLLVIVVTLILYFCVFQPQQTPTPNYIQAAAESQPITDARLFAVHPPPSIPTVGIVNLPPPMARNVSSQFDPFRSTVRAHVYPQMRAIQLDTREIGGGILHN